MSATVMRLRETVKTKFTYVRPLREADGVMVDKKNRVAKVVIISEGLGNLRDRNYYSEDAVKSCPKVFNGRQFYIDHPSESEESDRPERSVRDLAGYFFDCEVGKVRDPETNDVLPACFGKLRFANSEPGRLAMEQVAMALEYQKQFPNSKDVYSGISINGGGVSHPATIRGMEVNMVTAIEEAFSADIVTKPARGGRFVALMREAAKAADYWRKTRTRSTAQPARVGSKEAVMVHPKKQKRKQEADRKDKPKGKLKETAGGVVIEKPKPVVKESKGTAKGLAVSTEAKDLFESIKGQLATKMREGGEGVAVMIDDIKSDLDKLGELLGAAPQAEDEHMAAEDELEDEGETEDDEAEGEGEGEGEEENEGFGKDVSDAKDVGGDDSGDDGADGDGADGDGDELDDDDDLGMTDEDDAEGEGEGEGKGGGQLMRYSCGKCGEANEVAPPKGYTLAKMGESARKPMTESQAMKLLEHRLQKKEARFVRSNQKHLKEAAVLVKENRHLKARLGAINRLAEAKKRIKEAGVVIDLTAKDLIAFPREQWTAMIEREIRRVKREGEMFGTAAVPRGGNVTVKESDGKDAISTFRAGYKTEDGTQS